MTSLDTMSLGLSGVITPPVVTAVADELRQLLMRSMEEHDLLTIRYDGGTQPGAVRDVGVLAVMGDKVRVIELATGGIKNLLIAQITVVHEGHFDHVEEYRYLGRELGLGEVA